MLVKLLSDSEAEHVLMVFDAGKETFRNELYEEYKANRDECPEDLAKQMPYFREISEALGFPIIEVPGYEADDIIGTAVRRLSEGKVPVTIVSADKDLMQLVSEGVEIWDTMRDRRFGPKEVLKKLGVPPEKVIEYLAIAGDSSDNIPGLKGAGPKTAVQLVETFGTVENLIEKADELAETKQIRNRKKLAETLREDPEILKLSKELVTVRDDIEFVLPTGDGSGEQRFSEVSGDSLLELLKRRELERERLEALVEQFEFQSLVEDGSLDISLSSNGKESKIDSEYTLVFEDDVSAFLQELKAQSSFCFDLETSSLDFHEAEIAGVAFGWDEVKGYYLPLNHTDSDGKKQLSLDQFKELFGPIFADPSIQKVGQNLKFDISILAEHGVSVEGPLFDTMVAAYLLHPDKGGYGLSALAKEYVNHTMVEFDEVADKDGDFRSVPLQEALRYAAEDAHITWLLKDRLEALLKEAVLFDLLAEIDGPLVRVLSEIERSGMRLDTEFLAKMSDELKERLTELEKEIFQEAGTEFNLNSPKQLGEVLFEKLGISTKGVKKTKTGYSTNQAVLEKLESVHAVPALILKYRGLFKLKSTYVDALPAQVSPKTGRLHTRLNQTIAATGRLSSSQPNLQNIPVQTELGRRVRKAFVAEEGNTLISADYSQIELRLLAHLSGDEALQDAFRRNEDVHARTARELFGIGEDEEVSSGDRRIGKTINFGIVYGMSGFRLGRELGIPVKTASEYIEQYFERYAGVREYFDHLEEVIEEKGVVETLYGRKRIVSEIDPAGRDKSFVKRAAMNAPLQGSAADLIKLAMIRLYERIKAEDLTLRMVLQVHDELLFECPSGFQKEAIVIIREIMESSAELSVPLRVDVRAANNWEEAH